MSRCPRAFLSPLNGKNKSFQSRNSRVNVQLLNLDKFLLYIGLVHLYLFGFHDERSRTTRIFLILLPAAPERQ